MKTTVTFLFVSLFTMGIIAQDIMISGIGHGYVGGSGLVELYVINDIDSDQYFLRSVRADGSTIGTFSIFGPLSAGTRFYITSDDYYFEPFFGIPFTHGAESVGYFNGDDIIILSDVSFVTVDIYGEEGVDGTGTDWDYADGWAYRKMGFGPNATFTISEWDVVTYAFDFCSGTNASCTDPYPIGSYTLSSNSYQLDEFRVVPNPTNKGFVTILAKDHSSMEIQLFDVFGKQLLETKLNDSRLDVSNLGTGIYFIKVSKDNLSCTKKLVIN